MGVQMEKPIRRFSFATSEQMLKRAAAQLPANNGSALESLQRAHFRQFIDRGVAEATNPGKVHGDIGGGIMKRGLKLLLVAIAGAMLLANVRPLRAQELSPASKTTTLWVDQKTGQVFIRPGRGRTPMTIGGTVDSAQIEQQVEQNTDAKVRTEVTEAQEQQRAEDAELA
jgi:hypothetical protein